MMNALRASITRGALSRRGRDALEHDGALASSMRAMNTGDAKAPFANIAYAPTICAGVTLPAPSAIVRYAVILGVEAEARDVILRILRRDGCRCAPKRGF